MSRRHPVTWLVTVHAEKEYRKSRPTPPERERWTWRPGVYLDDEAGRAEAFRLACPFLGSNALHGHIFRLDARTATEAIGVVTKWLAMGRPSAMTVVEVTPVPEGVVA